LAGKEAIGVELRVVKKYEGRVVIGVPNHLTKYLRSAIVIVGRSNGTALVTVKVSGTMRKALAIASSVQYLFHEFQNM
jgi:RNase P/RNase MRP subunit POP5